MASKFWEDINFWNVDYVEAVSHFPLLSINRLECEFMAMCNYELFVSAELYSKYYLAIKEYINPAQKKSALRGEPRFTRLSDHQHRKDMQSLPTGTNAQEVPLLSEIVEVQSPVHQASSSKADRFVSFSFDNKQNKVINDESIAVVSQD